MTPWAATHQAFLHGLPECAQTHVHWISDAIQLFHTLALPSLLALNLSQHQGLFQWVSSCYQEAKILEFKISASASVLPMNIQCWFPLGLTDLISLLSKRLSRVFSNTIVQKYQFFRVQPSLWSNSHIWSRKTRLLTIWTLVSKVMSLLFNMLCSFVIALLLRSKQLLI